MRLRYIQALEDSVFVPNEEDRMSHLDVLMDQACKNIIEIDLPVSSLDDLDSTAINILGRPEVASDSLLVPSNKSVPVKLPRKTLHETIRQNETAPNILERRGRKSGKKAIITSHDYEEKFSKSREIA